MSDFEPSVIAREEHIEWAVDFRGLDVQPAFRCIVTHPDHASALAHAKKTGRPLIVRTVASTVTATTYRPATTTAPGRYEP